MEDSRDSNSDSGKLSHFHVVPRYSYLSTLSDGRVEGSYWESAKKMERIRPISDFREGFDRDY